MRHKLDQSKELFNTDRQISKMSTPTTKVFLNYLIQLDCSLEQWELQHNPVDINEGNLFMGSIITNNVNSTEWIANIFVSKLKRNVSFLIDSGADISRISKEFLNSDLLRQLKKCDKVVTGPSDVKLEILGILSVK